MKPRFNKHFTSLIWLVSIAVTCWLGYYCLEGNDWYSRHDHLGNLLRAGMTTNDVMAVLGPPEIQMSVTGGDRWSYSDQGPTSGAGCVVDFAPEGGVLRLRYFLNYQHLLFRDGLHREFGSPVDGGSFKDDPFLKLRWDEWHGKKLDR